MFEKLQIPVFGIIHNMSSVVCSKCSHKTPLFGDHFDEFSKTNGNFFAIFILKLELEFMAVLLQGIDILENIPLDPRVSDGCDNGVPVVVSHPESSQVIDLDFFVSICFCDI